MEIKNIEVNGVKLFYYEKGQGKLLLFLHGFPDNADSFFKQMEYFSEKGYRVVVPFMRGYYPSEIPKDKKYHTMILGKDVAELIEGLTKEKAIVIGHDWGASAAYAAAIIAPELIEKIVAVSVVRGTFSKALITNPTQQRKSWYIYFFQTAMAERALAFDNYSFIRGLYKDWSCSAVAEEHIEKVIETFRHEGVAGAAIEYYRCFFDHSRLSEDELKIQRDISTAKIKVPVLYLHGEKDGCIGSELCEGMEEYFENRFEIKIIKDAGHFIHLEKEEEFNRVVFDFIEK